MVTLSTATVGLTASMLGPATDALRLGGGKDKAHGKRGDDYISAVDGSEDFISCGPGADRARANPGDNVQEGSETIERNGVRVD
jgi:hypothetical protein